MAKSLEEQPHLKYMPKMEAREYGEFFRREQKRVGKNLTHEEFQMYAFMRWVQRNHSESNPNHPEFPPKNPRFPATPFREIKLHGLAEKNIKVYLKDESQNPTGTHKDRMAWEISKMIYQMLESKIKTGKPSKIPEFSVLSAGNTANSLQYMLSQMGGSGVTRFHALMDNSLPEKTVNVLQRAGVSVHTADFKRKKLTSDDILKGTKNPKGIDLTLGKFVDKVSKVYYDWLSFEIMNLKPTHVIVPYGSGQLFDNFLDHYHGEYRKKNGKDPRLLPKNRLRGVNLIGVTAFKENTLASKLYAPFKPGSIEEETTSQKHHAIEQFKRSGILGELSMIAGIENRDLLAGKKLADSQKLKTEFSGIAGLSWLIKHKHLIRPNSRIVVVNTGRGEFAED
ncbi:PLP-dependent lyase/thiolase [Candidatus Micrarchaeota archaeon]|nr:PLP-dependent lyase/thiolase [Candidatus Micrarchaeota archaeon]